MSNWNKRIRAAREAQKMTREMVVQKMQQFLPESEKAVTTRSLISWEAGEREPRVTVGVALAMALGFEDVADLYLDSEPKLNQVGQQRLLDGGNPYRGSLCRHWRRSSGRILTWKAPQGPFAWKHRYSFPACIHSECKICELLCTAQSRAGVSTQWCKYLQTDHVELDHPVC